MEQSSKLKTNKGERKYTIAVCDALSRTLFWVLPVFCFVSFSFSLIFTRDKLNYRLITLEGKGSSSPVSCSKQIWSEQASQGTSSRDIQHLQEPTISLEKLTCFLTTPEFWVFSPFIDMKAGSYSERGMPQECCLCCPGHWIHHCNAGNQSLLNRKLLHDVRGINSTSYANLWTRNVSRGTKCYTFKCRMKILKRQLQIRRVGSRN